MASSDISLRFDVMLAEQREVFDYWCGLKGGAAMPARSAFRPGPIVRHLPMVSLVEIVNGGETFRFRLAGTGLRAIYGEDVTGSDLKQAPVAEDYWGDVYRRIASSGAPAQGFVSVRHRERSPMIQAWLRLPLAGEDGRPYVILGYDRFLPVEKLGPKPPAPFTGAVLAEAPQRLAANA